jgi:hypothetical protein
MARSPTPALAALALALAAPAAGSPAPPAGACRMQVSRAVLPVWARGGFHGGPPRLPHVLGRSGRIVAVVFGYPLRSPQLPDRANKILWVPRTVAGRPAALWIRAQRMEGSRPVGAPVGRVLAGGPGPSYVTMPSPGCWRLTLAWSGRTDTLDLAYGAGPGR